MQGVFIVLALLLAILVLMKNAYHPLAGWNVGWGRISLDGFQGGGGVGPMLVIAKASWCGACKSAASFINGLASSSPLKLPDGSTVTVRVLDADNDPAEMKRYQVRGYPTFLLVNGGDQVEYSGPRTKEDIMNWIGENVQ